MTFRNLAFISSDSGSAGKFLGGMEDGFAAYSMSKAALNMGVRHLACELIRKHDPTNEYYYDGTGRASPVVLAIHPGEVKTDMATSINVPWTVEGQMEVEESVRGVLKIIDSVGWGGLNEGGGKESKDQGATFWDWNGKRHPW
jgi:NAD(P)-dependent dehydrogenase (short-subunit alcohol dehydrogenase family)